MIFLKQSGKIPRMVSFKQPSILSSPGKKQVLPLVTTDKCLIGLGMVQGYPGFIWGGWGEVLHKK